MSILVLFERSNDGLMGIIVVFGDGKLLPAICFYSPLIFFFFSFFEVRSLLSGFVFFFSFSFYGSVVALPFGGLGCLRMGILGFS